jgi:hypothetical protein
MVVFDLPRNFRAKIDGDFTIFSREAITLSGHALFLNLCCDYSRLSARFTSQNLKQQCVLQRGYVRKLLREWPSGGSPIRPDLGSNLPRPHHNSG